MNPSDIRDIKRLSKIQSNYTSELTQGKVSKNFQALPINLVQEYLDNKAISSPVNSSSSSPSPVNSPSSPTIPQKRRSPEPFVNVTECKESLKLLLRSNETVSQAILRIRGEISKPKPFKKNLRKGVVVEKKSGNAPSADYTLLCQLCSDLIASGIDELYSLTKDDF